MKTGLVLSGGGMKGVAHLGVLKVLQDYNLQVDGVVGTSAGSIVGASLALDISPEDMLWEIKKARPKDLYDLPWWTFLLWHIYQFMPRGKFSSQSLISLPKGLMSGNRIEQWLTKIYSPIAMDVIDFPLAITATDINSADSIIFLSRGFEKSFTIKSLPRTKFISGTNLAAAVRASSAIPGVFAPKKINNHLLVDGGVNNNLPANVLKALGCEKILGVDLGQQENLTKPVSNVFDISIKAIELMVQSTSRITSATYCDLTIIPKTGPISLWNMSAIDRAYEAGVEAATQALPEIKKIFAS